MTDKQQDFDKYVEKAKAYHKELDGKVMRITRDFIKLSTDDHDVCARGDAITNTVINMMDMVLASTVNSSLDAITIMDSVKSSVIDRISQREDAGLLFRQTRDDDDLKDMLKEIRKTLPKGFDFLDPAHTEELAKDNPAVKKLMDNIRSRFKPKTDSDDNGTRH